MKKTQMQKVREHLNAGFSITPLEALTLFGSLRLSAIIFNLRADGVPVKTKIIEVKTRAGVAHVARYYLEKF